MSLSAQNMVKRGTPGRKNLRKLNTPSVELANHTASNEKFQDKFSHPKKDRKFDKGLPASPWVFALRKWRDREKLSARMAAAELGVPFDTYRGWEAGKHMPCEFTRRQISKIIMEA